MHSHRQFKIGVLVSLTGSWSSLGQNTVAALQLAEDQLEANAKAEHGGYRFKLLVRDTQLDAAKALAAIVDLHKRGVQIVIGPQSSAEVAAIKPYADAHNILVISQGSTASSLAIRAITSSGFALTTRARRRPSSPSCGTMAFAALFQFGGMTPGTMACTIP